MNSNIDVAVLVGSLRKEAFTRKLAMAMTALAQSALRLAIIEIGQLSFIADAKTLALSKISGFVASRPAMITLPERAALEPRLEAVAATLAPHDQVIGRKLVDILSGGTALEEAELTARATGAFVELALSQPTRDRIAHMLKTGKPLRN